MKREQLIKNGLKYQFKNEVQDDTHILTLSGIVAKPDLFDILLDNETINAKSVAEALDDVDKNIVVRINSGGGDGYEGIEIYNYLKNHPSHVTVEVTGLAASAASIIAMAGDKVVMNTGTSMMIHEASTIAWGNKTDLYKAIDMLETADASLVDIYAERTGLSAEELNNLVGKETWLTADEAVAKGFADEKSSKKAEGAEEEAPLVASADAKVTDLEEFKEMMASMQNEIKAIKNAQQGGKITGDHYTELEKGEEVISINKNKTNEPQAKKGFERFVF